MKKLTLIFLMSILWLSSYAFGSAINQVPNPMSNKRALVELQQKLQKSFNTFDNNLAVVAKKMGHYGVAGPEVEAILRAHFNAIPDLMIVSTIDSKGRLAAAYSPKYKTTIGNDVSFQVDVKKVLTTHRPVLSELVHTVQGPIAIILYHPVFSPKNIFLGAVCDLVTPGYLIKDALENLKNFTAAEIWILQTDGRFVYNSANTALIDRSIVSDNIYPDSPEKLKLGAKILKENSGTYKFNTSTTKSGKVATWTSVKLLDTFWRIVIID